ncbi:hypothetical protein RCH33_270 [Flavobacterium daejeonense]|nr:hypothetical protein RCH33_270 [Flavobacterium daejeonense]
METTAQQQANFNFRAVTIADLDTIIKLYQEQKKGNSKFNQHFGLPLLVAELNDKIVGYSYASNSNSNVYQLKTYIDTAFEHYFLQENLIQKSELLLKEKGKNLVHKNLDSSITRLINWLNYSYS